ncbi:hypothetical protein ACP4J0_20165 [Streptomyces sp. WG7]
MLRSPAVCAVTGTECRPRVPVRYWSGLKQPLDFRSGVGGGRVEGERRMGRIHEVHP